MAIEVHSPLYCVNYSSVTLQRPLGMLQEKYSSPEMRLAPYTFQQVKQKEVFCLFFITVLHKIGRK